jgi:hypothetical protein
VFVFRHHRLTSSIVGCAFVAGLGGAAIVHAQRPDDHYADRYDRNGHYDAYTRLAQLDAGTFITVRTRQSIDTDKGDGRVFIGTVDQDVWDDYRRLAVPAIKAGSPVEMLVRSARDGDLILDLDSVTTGGQRYAISASPQRVDAGRPEGGNQGAAYVGGGAILGTIVGAIAGGGKGAAIGAVAGAAVGAGLMTQGRYVRVPAGSVLTFRLDRPLSVGVRDVGVSRGDVHYHR